MMDIFFPQTFRERAAFKESAVKCGFVELTAETTANVGILPADERISTLLMAWENIGNYLTKNPYNHDVSVTVNWVCRCTLNLWFGREWIACAIENKTDLIEQMMKVYPTAFITMHPYSWPYMFSIYRDPWMVEYLNLNFQRMSGSDLSPTLELKDSEFIQQEGIPLLILRMVNMFDFRMVKLVKYMCLRLLLTWQDQNSTSSKTLRSSPSADQYIDYARHIYMLSICESNGFKDLHYTLETIQRIIQCDLAETWPLELGEQAIAKGLQESNKTLTELLIAFLFKVPKSQFGNMFGAALTKYIMFITEYQLRNINRISSVSLPWPLEEVYSKLVEMFITHRESSEDLIKTTSKLSEQIFLGFNNLRASKCAYELIKHRSHAEWHASKITLLLTIICEEINIIQDYKYNDVQSTDELIEKEKDLAVYYRDLAKLFYKSPYLEQEAWLTTFSLHPCREFMDAVTRCGARNLRAIKKQAQKLKVIEIPEPKAKIKEEEKETISNEAIVPNLLDTAVYPITFGTSVRCLQSSDAVGSISHLNSQRSENKHNVKRAQRRDKNGPKKIEPKINERSKNKTVSNTFFEENQSDNKNSNLTKRGRPVGSLGKDTKSRFTNSTKKATGRNSEEKSDLAEEIFAAAAGAADNINIQTVETIRFPAFALMNSVTDTEELMKFTNYDEAFEQYTELSKILTCVKLNNTCCEDLLTLLIAPRYKRLTWAVCWKKLKKRCRIILTKDNKKRELVEQSMADANDRLTHLNIDYEKYKDKPQIDYGTIEGGYECFDTDSDDDIRATEADVKKTKEIIVSKKRSFDSGKEFINKNKDQQNVSMVMKPYLKIENLDSSSSNLLNIIDSTHLSKPVYLNKPVYFVRNLIASPSSEAAMFLETGLKNNLPSQISSRRSTGEETLTSDSFEEHHWNLTTTDTSPEVRQSSQEEKLNISQFKSSNLITRSFLKTETTFNIPASIRQQLDQPTMFFKSEPKNEWNGEENICEQDSSNNFQNKQTETLNFPPSNSTNLFNHNKNPDGIKPGRTIFSPKLFEDMPQDLTMPKPLNIDLFESNTVLQTCPLNLTSRLTTDGSSCKTNSLHESLPALADKTVKRLLKRGTTQPRYLTTSNSTKRQPKESPQDLKTECSNTESPSSQCSITEPTSSLKSVRILKHDTSKAIRINPTAAVVFSSAAASYHRTPFLNAAQHEPNILQQLLSKEINFFGKTNEEDVNRVSDIKDKRKLGHILDSGQGTLSDIDTTNSMTNSTLKVRNSNDITEVDNSKTNISEQLAAEEVSPSTSVLCEKKQSNNSVYKTEMDEVLQNAQHETLMPDAQQKNSNALKEPWKSQSLFNSFLLNASVGDTIRKNPTTIENLSTIESTGANNFSKIESVGGELCTKNEILSYPTINASNSSDQLENNNELDSFKFEFKVPAAVAKPCFFMRSKVMKVNYCASDWVKNVMFNDKTAEIIVPGPITNQVTATFQHKKTKIPNIDEKTILNEVVSEMKNILTNEGFTPIASPCQPDDILYNKHIVFNKKLLDPHLKTYKNTKTLCKLTDAKKLEESFSDKDEFFSENPEEPNIPQLKDVGSTCLVLDYKNQQQKKKEHSSVDSSTSDSFPGQPPTFPQKSFLDKGPQKSEKSLKVKKKRSRSIIPSTKNFDKMFEWLDMVTTSGPESVPEHLDPSGTLLNLFSAQLMNQAKSIHFNYEYLQEKSKLAGRVNEEGINCEASILLASPGASSDGVKLIKAFKKSSVFKGLDLSSNEVSFTSTLAKEVLGTIVKVTLNESENHASCCGNHFDASDALDEFVHSRRDLNSPTFYSPTLSIKHLRNGTLADSVECIDTSLEKLIPKPGRKRSSMNADLAIKKKNRTHLSIDSKISNQIPNSMTELSQLPVKEITILKCSAEVSNTDVQHNKSASCLSKEDASENVFLDQTKVKKTFDQTFNVEENILIDRSSIDNSSENVFYGQTGKINSKHLSCNVEQNKLTDSFIIENAFENESLGQTETPKPLSQFPNGEKHKTADCLITEQVSGIKYLEHSEKTKSCTEPSNLKSCFNIVHNLAVELKPKSEIKNTKTFLINEAMESAIENTIPGACLTKAEFLFENTEKEKDIGCDLNFHEPLKSECNNHSSEQVKEAKIMSNCDESKNSKLRQPYSSTHSHHKEIPLERNKIEENNSIYSKTKRNTYEATKLILQDESVTIFRPEEQQYVEDTKKLSENQSENEKEIMREEITIQNSIGKNACNEHLEITDILNTADRLSSTEVEQFQAYNVTKKNEIFISTEKNVLQLKKEKLNIEENSLEQEIRPLPTKVHSTIFSENQELNTEENIPLEKYNTNKSGKIIQNHSSKIIQQLSIETDETKYLFTKMSSEEENKSSSVKKRFVKPKISYAELDSDSDELLRTRLKIPSLKINFPSIRPARRKLLKKKLARKAVSNKSTAKRPASKRIKKLYKKTKKNSEYSKINPSSGANDSDDDKPLISKMKEIKVEKVKDDYRLSMSAHELNESDEDVPLKRMSRRRPSKKIVPKLSPLKTKQNPSKYPVRKHHRNAYSPKKPSVIKFSRRRTASLNYFALFLSDSDEDEPIRCKRRKSTADRLWTYRTAEKKLTKESAKKKTSYKNERRCSRDAIERHKNRNHLTKAKTSIVKMPVLTREHSDQTDEENIYECATISTANETDDEACVDHRHKKRRQKVVKPMRIRCVSRRAIPTDVITESSSCSSFSTTQTARALPSNSTSFSGFPTQERLLRKKTLEKNLLMSKLLHESSSSSSSVIMNRRNRQFVAKSTSKPIVIESSKHFLIQKSVRVHNAKSSQPLTSREKEAIYNNNCVNFQIRLQRLTTNEANLCRKPYIRLDKNFVENYLAGKQRDIKYNLNYSENLSGENKE
ncbi:uncharacterized protein LOC129908808 [Episyrphus balteatus]|uniref:uncharacterized protein LOC129908808 n=1 Tax=Episyrphus balteatus TaxID=286459 RepID=UPI0024851E3A|nr:uncharacterized protein LOC129908808 [Episyrphus balteatus]